VDGRVKDSTGRFGNSLRRVLRRVEVALFECLGVSIRDFPGFFVLVLRVSSTRTRRYRIDYEIEYEYEYHFIEYEYERSQNGATSKLRSAGSVHDAMGAKPMTAIVTLIFIAMFSWLAIKVATTALTMTGLSFDTASFQSYSAFFGVGFTTKEAELVVNHPVRRRIIRDLILIGNIGLTSALATMVATFVQGNNVFQSLMIILAAVAIALAFSYLGRLRLVRKTMDRWISYSLTRVGLVRALDYELLLRVEHGYVVSEYVVEPDNPLVGKMLRHSRPWDSGVIVLAIRREEELLPGIPGPNHIVDAGDVLVLYGQEKDAKRLMQMDMAGPGHATPTLS